MIQYICQTPIVVDIQTHWKHVDSVIGVDIVILHYVCCHDDDSNNFIDLSQFSVLQEAWVIFVYYSSWSSSQFYVEISCHHHVHMHKYLYYYYAEELLLFPKMFNVKCCSTYAY